MNFTRTYFTNKPKWLKDLLLSLLTALSFSGFIYFEYFHLPASFLNTLNALLAISLLLTGTKRAILMSGFFIGLLWFYWIGYSFQYYGMSWMVPLVSLGFGFVYLLFFGTLALTYNVYLRAIILFILSFVAPFYFNWMQIELIFVNSYFGVEKWQYIIILLSLSLTLTLPKPLRFFTPLLLIFALNFNQVAPKQIPLKIKLVSTDIPQELKWLPQMRHKITLNNLANIDKAIKDGYELVVLPESAFTMFLNQHPDVVSALQARSYKIAILTGALYDENGQHYNVSYLFHNGKIDIAKKMVLVPFGEYIPLPKFMRRTINDTFFNGASDYLSANKPTDFVIKNTRFRNAICYEATTPEIYQDNPKCVIAMSNNAWFTPSIEPTLQALLLKYYAHKNNTRIYHVTNGSGSSIIPILE